MFCKANNKPNKLKSENCIYLNCVVNALHTYCKPQHNTTQHNTTNCVGPFLTPFQLSGEEAAVGELDM